MQISSMLYCREKHHFIKIPIPSGFWQTVALAANAGVAIRRARTNVTVFYLPAKTDKYS
jgi:DNA/RNA endonuclease G (NUC1)